MTGKWESTEAQMDGAKFLPLSLSLSLSLALSLSDIYYICLALALSWPALPVGFPGFEGEAAVIFINDVLIQQTLCGSFNILTDKELHII